MSDALIIILIIVSTLFVVLFGVQIWVEIRNDPPYPIWWDDEELEKWGDDDDS